MNLRSILAAFTQSHPDQQAQVSWYPEAAGHCGGHGPSSTCHLKHLQSCLHCVQRQRAKEGLGHHSTAGEAALAGADLGHPRPLCGSVVKGAPHPKATAQQASHPGTARRGGEEQRWMGRAWS